MDGTRPSHKTKTTCPYCGVGCGVIVTRHEDGLTEVKGDPDHPANYGRLCSKGAALGETLSLDDRLLYPEIDGEKVKWDAALNLVAETFKKTIAKHGPDSVAFYVSGQFLTEDYYVANKLMKGYIGSANIDTNSRLCMASTVVGHNRAFGGDIVPGCYEDLELADLIVLVGSNLAWCHPVLFQRILAAKAKRPDMRLVVIDPRRTVTADAADLHLAIRPDGDTALYNLLLSAMAKRSCLDLDFIDASTDGFADVLGHVSSMKREDLLRETGLPAEDVETFIDWVCATDKTVTVFSQGVNQSASGTDKVNAIINTHLATGRIGKPGAGPFSVTGQPNAMGGREVGGLANQLAAHMKIENPDHRKIVQDFWQSPTIADRQGLKAVDLFDKVASGDVKAVWIMATNPVDSLPRTWAVEQALKDCPFVVISENVAATDTLRHAHVKLPATAWGEKTGTVTNSERRISRQRPFSQPPGAARHDWWILCEVAKRMGWADAFDYAGPADIYREHAALSAYENSDSRAFNISEHQDLDDDAYDALVPVQWPITGNAQASDRVLDRGDFFTPERKAKFIGAEAKAKRTANGAFTLNTGRIRDHWHTMTRTAKTSTLSSHFAEPFLSIHPDDAKALEIDAADLVIVQSLEQTAIVRALVTDRQAPGDVFVPMHWTDQYASAGRVGRVVDCDLDPYSGQPALKTGDVTLKKFDAAWYGFAVLRQKPMVLESDYWALAACDGGWRVEMASSSEMIDPAAFAESLVEVDIQNLTWTQYGDSSLGQHRFAARDALGVVGMVFLAKEPVRVSRTWAASLLRHGPITDIPLLAGRAGTDQPDPGPIVCACFGIGANQIKSACQSGCRSVDEIGKTLSAGTNCGSCKTEIGNILSSQDLKPVAN